MSGSRPALIVDERGAAGRIVDRPEPRLADGDVLIEATASSLNYKDALAVTGAPGVLRAHPLVPGIDVAGRVARGAGGHREGDRVVLTGAGLGEERDGGFAGVVAVPAEALIRIADRFDERDAAAIGTAGFTAALAVLALERAGLDTRDLPVAVTGAGGGVGGFASVLLAARGHRVAAITGRADSLGDRLRALGAEEVLDRNAIAPDRPLGSPRWAGAVDSLGGAPLASLLARAAPGTTVAACGLAAGSDLPATVLPFILRGVALAGIDSVRADAATRRAAWALLETALPAKTIGLLVSRTVPLGGVVDAAHELLDGRVDGRVLIDPTRIA